MSYELVIIGAGITGLTAANKAQELGINNVLIVDYEKQKGGFGSTIFDREDFLKEKEIVSQADKLPYEFWYQATVVGFFEGENGENHQISIQTPNGSQDIEAKKVIFSSGSMEKPREGNKIPGSRPAGVMTSLMALELLDRGYLPGKDMVIIENSKIAKAVADLSKENGADVNSIKSEFAKIKNIKGNSRVTGVEIENTEDGEIYNIPCDTFIYSEGTIPCTFYLKGSMVDLDEHLFIKVDEDGKTNIPNVIAIGSCANKADQFDVFSTKTSEIIENFLTRQNVGG
ncbi:NAD(P)/FAD-dependent oxidoreductase [Bacillus sp. JJ1521]|uniref:NAD(P)/FAD-dependent oxidoreductase n=1 Tax=Bacillus sp. JJ1521 TaxID=3122957 RepID=UPI003000D2C7